MGLDDVYQLITSTLLTRDPILRDPIPNVNSAFSVISREESHRGSSSSSSENKAQAFVFAAKIHNYRADHHIVTSIEKLENVVDISDLDLQIDHPNRTHAFIKKVGNLKLGRIPLYFWRGCVLTAIYVINRLPYSMLKEDDASDGSDIDSTLLGDFPSAVNREMVTTSYDDITMEQNSTFKEKFTITNVNNDQPNLRKSSSTSKSQSFL
nr:putative Gag-polypeptide of LTR copia-type [Tanacetum cinerariifolium]